MNLLLAILIAILAASCQTTSRPPEPWAVKVYSGDAAKLGAVRDNEVIKCSEAAFGDLVCMRSADFSAMIKYLLERQCD